MWRPHVAEAAIARQLHHSGQLQAAVSHYQIALQLQPDDAVLLHDAALCLMQLGDTDAATTLFLGIARNTEAWQLAQAPLAICLRDAGRLEEALAVAERVVAIPNPKGWQWMLLGDLQRRLGQTQSACGSLQHAIARSPDLLEARHLLGQLLQEHSCYEEAIAHYEVVARDLPMEHFNIAQCLEHLGRWSQARDAYRVAHLHAPTRADVLSRLAHIHAQLCEFDAVDENTLRLAARVQAGPLAADDVPQPFTFAALPLDIECHQKLLDHAASPFAGLARLPAQAVPRRPGRLRIGYLSSDLRTHTVGALVRRIFAAHDRARFEVHVYDTATPPAAVDGAEHLHHVTGLNDAALAGILRKDDLDILIDLNGPTSGGRLGALARRPARLQLGWLGYLSGQQAPWLDAIVLDHDLAPPDQPWPFSDVVLRLNGSAFPADHQQVAPVRDRHRWNLPDGVAVAASFNSSHKLSKPLLHCWSRILQQAPEAWLLVCLAPQAHPGFREAWGAVNGDSTRLRLLPPMPPAQYLDCMASCDLFLDAFDYQAGATAIDAAVAGLPLLTCPGTLPLARLGSSVNRQLGLQELICASREDYVQRAATALRSPDTLAELRARVIARSSESGLLDPHRVANDLEALYLTLQAGAWPITQAC